MQSPSPSPTMATTISNSLTNLQATLGRIRPWSELLPPESITRPDSLTSTLTRLKRNLSYFAINHAVITTLCTALALITAPFEFIIIAMIFASWLVFYFFKEDHPLVIWGRYSVDDNVVLVVLCAVSVLGVWWSGVEERLVFGVGVGLCLCVLHGVLRSTDGLFLNEEEAVTAGLIGAEIGSGSRSGK